MKYSVSTKKLVGRTLILIMVISGCSSQPSFYAPSKEIRQRMDRIVLRVISDTGLTIFREDELLVGSAEGAEYVAENNIKAAGNLGGSMVVTGCLDPRVHVWWFITCPIGLVAGAVVGVGGAIVGGVGGGVYGATQALSEEEIKSAAVTVNEAKVLFNKKLVSTFNAQLVSAMHVHADVRLIDDGSPDVAMGQSYDDGDLPMILAVRITGFKIIQAGKLDPDFSLQIFVSADFYDDPETGSLYTRKWSYLTPLGGYYDLTENDGAGLKQGITAALDTVANTIVKDLYSVAKSEQEKDKEVWEDDIGENVAKVDTVFSKEPVSRKGWFRDQRKKADCGDVDVQVLLGRAYGAIDPRIFGWRGRDEMMGGYYWLRVAQLSGRDDKEIVLYINEIKKNLEADEISKAEIRAQEWRPVICE